MEGQVIDQFRTATEEGVGQVCLNLRDVVVVNLGVAGEELAGVGDETRKSSREALSKHSVFKCQTVASIISISEVICNVAVESALEELADVVVVVELVGVVLEGGEEVHLLGELCYFS